MASADVSAGNAVQLYSDGNDVFDAMVELIDGAREAVMLESYIFRHDSTGQRIGRSLERAARRGVAVRMLGDWIGMRGTSASFIRQLRQNGVDVRVFNPPGLHRWLGLVPRDHRKLLVVDGRAGITGGIGIGDEWRKGIVRRRSMPWRDRCARIEGPAAGDFVRAFEHMWRRAGGTRPTRAERTMRRPARNTDIEPGTAAPALVGVVEGEPGRLRVGRALHLQAAAAERSIWLATAYFLPSFAEVDALTGAASDGVDVRLLLPCRNDHPWVYRFQRSHYRRLLSHGVRIWEWRGDMMHAKTSVVDGCWTRVGSTDFNPLGVAINFELDVYVNDLTVGARAEELFLSELELSHEIRHAPRDA
ncbi:MAG TPA: phosphatidylserine/phosphatidylglycerophosphate/cardiolipin synthase family protein [Gemmatimonadaceae bacterium]|nr:phosphatidylserine/phosphatidylglycerophosphate/cardiolipin synthase family protein [Gemmatimonadaceae bacterium]